MSDILYGRRYRSNRSVDPSCEFLSNGQVLITTAEGNNLLDPLMTASGSPSTVTRGGYEGVDYGTAYFRKQQTFQRQFAGTGNWTIACVAMLTSAPAGEFSIMGTNQANPPDLNVQDRALIASAGTGTWKSYLYDGAVKTADSGVTLVVGEMVTIVVTVYGGNLYTYVKRPNGVTGSGSTGVSNPGFDSYGPAQFFVGRSTDYVGSWFSPLALRAFEGWSPSKAQAFLDDPWQVLAPVDDDEFAGSAAAAFMAAWASNANARVWHGGGVTV